MPFIIVNPAKILTLRHQGPDVKDLSKVLCLWRYSVTSFQITKLGEMCLSQVIHCACCCEPFHHYCVEGMGTGVVEKGADWWLVDWVCARCTMCRSCGKGGGNQVSCQRCRKSFHTECLTADRVASKLHSADRPWVSTVLIRTDASLKWVFSHFQILSLKEDFQAKPDM